jgi:hypothetical protein
VVDGKTIEGDPLLGSAGKDPDSCYSMLASNRERELGTKQDVAQLKAELEGRGCVIHRYSIRHIAS